MPTPPCAAAEGGDVRAAANIAARTITDPTARRTNPPSVSVRIRSPPSCHPRQEILSGVVARYRQGTNLGHCVARTNPRGDSHDQHKPPFGPGDWRLERHR